MWRATVFPCPSQRRSFWTRCLPDLCQFVVYPRHWYFWKWFVVFEFWRSQFRSLDFKLINWLCILSWTCEQSASFPRSVDIVLFCNKIEQLFVEQCKESGWILSLFGGSSSLFKIVSISLHIPIYCCLLCDKVPSAQLCEYLFTFYCLCHCVSCAQRPVVWISLFTFYCLLSLCPAPSCVKLVCSHFIVCCHWVTCAQRPVVWISLFTFYCLLSLSDMCPAPSCVN